MEYGFYCREDFRETCKKYLLTLKYERKGIDEKKKFIEFLKYYTTSEEVINNFLEYYISGLQGYTFNPRGKNIDYLNEMPTKQLC